MWWTRDHGFVRTVLLVDDDSELLEMYELWLADSDEWTTRTATDGKEALEKLDGTVDVVVLDRRMPGIDGGEVVRAIRSSDHGCEVIVASAFQPDDGIDDHHYDQYLTKPIQMETLVDTISTQLDDTVTADP